jgi:hypothetical protein
MQTIEQIYQQHIKLIPIDEQLRLVSLITQNLAKAKKSPRQTLQEFRDATDLEALDIDRVEERTDELIQPKHSLLELKGLGAEIWQDIDAQEYINQLRQEWD